MHRRAILLILLAALPLQARRRPVDLPPAIPTAAIDAVIADKLAQGVPGMSVAIARGNVIVYATAQGELENGAPARPDSIYGIGSVSKQFGAAAIMRLEERGALRVTDSIDALVPELAGRGIRIEHLLQHTSGLPTEAGVITSLYAPLSRAEFLRRLALLPMDSQPGRVYAYRNPGYVVLGVIVERLSGKPYAQFLADEFFLPLGLTSTSVCSATGPSGFSVDRVTHARTPVRPPDPSILLGGGDICSNAIDLIRWTYALKSGLAVSRASYERMATPSPIPTGYSFRYGYGLVLATDRGNPVVLHDGWVIGFQAFLAHYPERDLTIAILGNGNTYADLQWVPSTAAGVEIGRLLVPAK